MNPTRIAIAGCTGRMGRTLVRLAAADGAFEVVAAMTVAGDPLLGRDAGVTAGIEPIDLPISSGSSLSCVCDVVIEFTLPDGCPAWAESCAAAGVPLVSGTTGLDEQQEARLHAAAEKIPIVWAPNMSVGVNLMLELVAELAAKLDESWDIEICETHHRRKVDAPSGTAQALLEAACLARKWDQNAVATHGRVGQCGPRDPRQIGVHAVRMGSVVGEHDVHFASTAESLTLRHRAFSREGFAVGALRAARWLQGREAGLYGMRDVLFE